MGTDSQCEKGVPLGQVKGDKLGKPRGTKKKKKFRGEGIASTDGRWGKIASLQLHRRETGTKRRGGFGNQRTTTIPW